MSTIIRYSNAVNSLINDMFKAANKPIPQDRSFTPAIDIFERENEYLLYADLPGLSKENVSISIEENILTIQGERQGIEGDENKYHYFGRKTGKFERSFKIPEQCDPETMSASMTNGELVLTLPKAVIAPKKITIDIQ